MSVRRADHAELVRVRAEFRLEPEAVLQGLASVFVLKHVVGLGLGEIEVARIPGIEVGELIGG